MCDRKVIEKIDKGEAIVFTKLKFYLSVIIIFASVVSAFSYMKYQIDNNSKKIGEFEHKIKGLDEIRYNLKSLCEQNGVKYIEMRD